MDTTLVLPLMASTLRRPWCTGRRGVRGGGEYGEADERGQQASGAFHPRNIRGRPPRAAVAPDNALERAPKSLSKPETYSVTWRRRLAEA